MSPTTGRRGRAQRVACGAVCIASVLALTAPAGAAAAWKTRIFTASYDGKGSFSYSAQGANGDTGCHMNLGGSGSYGFDQLWRVKAEFNRQSDGSYKSRVDSITHVDGPQAFGHYGSAHLKGRQTARNGDCFNEQVHGSDVGTFDCKGGAPTLTAWTNPQMAISRDGNDLVVLARSFIDAHEKYTGTDTIPSDNKSSGGCPFYNDDWTFGNTVLPGSYSTA
jgi:hypothetical protein